MCRLIIKWKRRSHAGIAWSNDWSNKVGKCYVYKLLPIYNIGGLITDKDSASVREKLQKDLQSTKSALEDIKKEEEVNAATSHERMDSTSESPAEEQGVYK